MYSGRIERPRKFRGQHVLAALICFWVFSVPFHVHPGGPAALNDQECVCHQGKRTLFVPVVGDARYQPTVLVSLVPCDCFKLPASPAIAVRRSRSPPLFRPVS